MMKTTLAVAFVLLAVAACSSEVTELAEDKEATTIDHAFASGATTAQETTTCTEGETRKCGACATGTQTCAKVGSGEIGAASWGVCEGEESDAACTTSPATPEPPKCKDGGEPAADGSCPRKMELNIDGDCLCAPACPADAPFIVGCKIDFQGSNTNGCVAPAKEGRIYFQEGVKCDSGHLSGFVLCSSTPGGPLDQKSCPINKSNARFGDKPSSCPEIESGKPDKCFF